MIHPRRKCQLGNVRWVGVETAKARTSPPQGTGDRANGEPGSSAVGHCHGNRYLSSAAAGNIWRCWRIAVTAVSTHGVGGPPSEGVMKSERYAAAVETLNGLRQREGPTSRSVFPLQRRGDGIYQALPHTPIRLSWKHPNTHLLFSHNQH